MVPLVAHRWFMRASAPMGVGAFTLALWQWACQHWNVPSYIFPEPTAIATSLAANHGDLLRALGSTLEVTVLAFSVAVAVGVTTAFLFVQSRLIELSLMPYVILAQVTPIAAVAPLIIILVKNTLVSLTICATVIAIFPIISNTTIGLRSVDPGLLSYFRMNKAGAWMTLWRLRIPGALPFFLAGLRISSGLALVGAVVAEFIAGSGGKSAGLAYEILQSSFQLDIPRMFAALFLITLTGLILFSAMVGLEHLLLGAWSQVHADQER